MQVSGASLLLPAMAAMAVTWFFSDYSMRRQIRRYKEVIRRLREVSGSREQSSQGSFDECLSAIDEAILRIDDKGRVIAANARARTLFHASELVLPQPFMFFYRDNDWFEAWQAAVALLPERMVLPDMQVGDRTLSPRIARLSGGQSLLLCMDITDKHRLEVQRRSFMANLMHDLKTPLTSLLGYARSLQRFGQDDEFRQEAIQVIADEAKHVNHLLESMLTLDQIEFAGSDPDAFCQADDVIRQVLDMLKMAVDGKAVDVRCQLDEMLPALRMDVDSFERIVRNLLENAVQYAPKGGVVLLSLQPHGDNMAHLSVQDNGPGIPDKHLNRVTERFYRVDKARSREYGGHGLGLAIVKELAEAHGGSVQLANVEPHGLAVSVLIPLEL
ncbi:two-component sensor histidine kinase [Mariprofundus erugo]|uniref:sensor histidine kinase n=1 Tax=Mariprofundus erugo TaxID=2528639 RepID=UPI0010FD044F|nr:ATP-binding protein [Mariprofundus erugo]TLS78002.1 two-component sensor histidine kinase [Mariprofundus erugo]